MTQELIKKAFKKTGIYPINRSVFQPEDFAPSKALLPVAHVPNSFPANVPSSDPVEPSDAEDEDFYPSDNDSELESNGSQPETNSDSKTSASDSDSDTETQSSMGDKENTLDVNKGGPVGQHEDEHKGQELEPSDSLSRMKPFSGLLASLAKIEDDVIHMTC